MVSRAVRLLAGFFRLFFPAFKMPAVHPIDKTKKATRLSLGKDLAAVRKALEEFGESQALEESCAAIQDGIRGLEIMSLDNFTTLFPMNPPHERIFGIQAAVWRKKGLKGITVWQKNPWDMMSPTEFPGTGGARVDVRMMRNEFRSAAFNISNADEKSATLSLSVEGLPGGINPESITVHDASFLDTKSGVPVMAALPFARRNGQGYLVEIHPGLTHQVWLTFHSEDVAPGEYEGSIVIEPAGLRVPVAWKVYPLAFPDRPTLHLGGWDYTNTESKFDVTPKNREALIRHLQEHFVDTPWASIDALPSGEYDPDGNMVAEPDAGNFEAWVRRWPLARNYYVYAACRDTFRGFRMGTPVFKKAVASWITWWVRKIKTLNIRADRLGLLLVDEPDSKLKSNVVIAYAKAIRNAEPDVVIWQNNLWSNPWKAPPELFSLSDVLCPRLSLWIQRGRRFADFYLKQQDAGRQLWFYSCDGPGKHLDPYAYHRLQQWFCWKYGAKGSCFWSFGDSNGSSSWNEYLATGPGAYTPLFMDEISVTPGKHMEAIREGVEDHEYLCMLRRRIEELEHKDAEGEAIDAVKELLASAANRVTGHITQTAQFLWSEFKDRSVADEVRIEILDALMKLEDPTRE